MFVKIKKVGTYFLLSAYHLLIKVDVRTVRLRKIGTTVLREKVVKFFLAFYFLT
jgi:hypothetical protein